MVLLQFPTTRHRSFKLGQIKCGTGTAVPTVVRNFSPTGAVLEINSAIGIPDEFILVIAANPFSRPCRVTWRKPRQIGVEFV